MAYGTEFTITDANERGYWPVDEDGNTYQEGTADDWYNALDDNNVAQPFPATIVDGTGPEYPNTPIQYRSLFLGFEIQKRVTGGSWFNLLPEINVIEDTYFPGIDNIGPYRANTFSLTGDWGEGYGPMFMRETAILNAGIHQFPNSELPELTNGIFNSFYDDGWPFFHPDNTIESNTTYEYRIRPVYEGVYTEGTYYGEPDGTIVKDDWSDIFDDPASAVTSEITRDIQIYPTSAEAFMEIDVFDISTGQPPQSWGPFQIKLVNIRPSLASIPYMNISHNIIDKLPAGGAWTKDISYPDDHIEMIMDDGGSIISPFSLDFNTEVLNIWAAGQTGGNYTLVENDRYVLEAHAGDVSADDEYNVVAITPPSIEFEQTSPMDILMPPEAFEGGSFDGNVVAMDYGPAGLLYSPNIVIKRTDESTGYAGVFTVDYQLSYSEDFMDFGTYGSSWSNADFTPVIDSDFPQFSSDITLSSGPLTFAAGEGSQLARFIITVDDLRLQETIGIQLSNARWNNIPVEITGNTNFEMDITPTVTSNASPVYITLGSTYPPQYPSWHGMSGNYNNASLTINDVNYTLGPDGEYASEETYPVLLVPGTYDWSYELPWYEDGTGVHYVSYHDSSHTWKVESEDDDGQATTLLEVTGNGSNQTGTFVVPNLTDEDDPDPILGCMDENYYEYNPDATEDTDPTSCVTQIIYGCTDTAALNYDSEAEEDDGSCEYPIPEFPSGTPPANPSWEAGTIWVDDDGNTWQYVWFTWNQVDPGAGNGLTTPPQFGWLFLY